MRDSGPETCAETLRLGLRIIDALRFLCTLASRIPTRLPISIPNKPSCRDCPNVYYAVAQMTPEDQARQQIDAIRTVSGRVVQKCRPELDAH